MTLTRRKLASLLSSAAGLALAPAQAQTPATPSAELQAARDRVKARSELLAKQYVSMSVEPAFQFKP
jgi:hypothetical protein